MVPQLPYDVIEEIVCGAGRRQLSQADLTRLCLVDTRFLQAARQELYYCVPIAVPLLGQQIQNCALEMAARRGGKCLAVLAHPHLGVFVRSLCSARPQDSASPPEADTMAGLELWRAVLAVCPNVRHIINSSYDLPMEFIFTALRGTARPICSVSGPLARPVWDWLASDSSCYVAHFSACPPFTSAGLDGLQRHSATSRIKDLELYMRLRMPDFQAIAATLGTGVTHLSLLFDPGFRTDLAAFPALESLKLSFGYGLIEKICNPSDPSAPSALQATRDALRLALATCAPSLTRLTLWSDDYWEHDEEGAVVLHPALLTALPPHLTRLDVHSWSPFNEVQNLDCFAPFSSLRVLGAPVWQIPEFLFEDDEVKGENWEEVFMEWCEQRGLTFVHLE